MSERTILQPDGSTRECTCAEFNPVCPYAVDPSCDAHPWHYSVCRKCSESIRWARGAHKDFEHRLCSKCAETN